MKEISKSRKPKDLQMKRAITSTLQVCKKYKMQRRLCKTFRISRKVMKPKPTTAHKKKITPEIKKTVQEFYQENAITLPHKRYVSKKTGKAAGFLTLPITKLYYTFKDQHPEIEIRPSKFAQLRPQHIRKARRT